ncbi:ASCH domain-containing protein [Pelosinus propionicus]|uniref:ASCH domain-containing protein n=1 Tax=Pelosinus propionicus DSM 13327 TaxID=1123291 RepID=A0A1I4MLV6_9FIRM|nr:RNA-binding protein [Pelosinus propionicus]SFM04016.1 hypothetical protein SAMN04490355_103514 [Pelosinus propionicus DSM 13327]
MFALNFQSSHHEELLQNRVKNCTVRLGDLRDVYAENSLVWITFGKKLSPRRKMYQAIIDKILIKKFSQLTADDLIHQNPSITTTEELIKFFEALYCKSISPNDIVSVIYFSEVVE